MTKHNRNSTSYPILAILDVGHGNSAVLTDIEGVVVIDAGPRGGLLEYLVEQEITKVDVVLISHADADHIGGLIGLIASGEFQIAQVRLNTDSLKASAIWDDLLYELDKANQSGEIDFEPSLTTNDTGKFDRGGINIEILAPTPYLAGKGAGSTDRKGRRLDTNSISAVIRLSKDEQSMAIFLGDLDEIGLDNLFERNVDIFAPVLVFPHHGGKAGHNTNMAEFSRRLCEMVTPQVVIFSIGRGKYKTPLPEVISAIHQYKPNIRIVCTQLSEHCAASLPKAEPNHLTKVFSDGREQGKCCAGTLIINFDGLNTILPLHSAHQSFILENAPTALCQQEVAE